MRPDKRLFLCVSLAGMLLVSCQTTDTNAADSRGGEESTAEMIQEAGADSEPSVSEDQRTAEIIAPPEPETPPEDQMLLPEAAAKEAHKGGQKIRIEAETMEPTAEEASDQAMKTAEDALEEDTGSAAVSGNEAELTAGPLTSEILNEEHSEAPRTEETEGPALAAPADPDAAEIAAEQESDLTVSAGTETTDAPSDLPSEREDITYNPLLPIVVDAPPTRDKMSVSDSDTSDTEKAVLPATTASEGAEVPEMAALPEKSPVETPFEKNSISPEQQGQAESTASIPEEIDDQELRHLSLDDAGKLIIELQGSGWIFLTADDDEGVTLRDKSYNPDSGTTRFVFSSDSPTGPEGRLIFLHQDLLRGESQQKRLDLAEVLPSGTDTISPNETAEAPEKTVSLSPAASEAAATRPPDGPAESAYPAPEEAPPAATATPAAAAAEPVELPGDAASLLELARHYESPGPEQSLEMALDLYMRIKREFPVTEERFIAETRIRYLNKHYFKVQ